MTQKMLARKRASVRGEGLDVLAAGLKLGRCERRAEQEARSMDPIRVDEILETVREDHELVAEQLRMLDELEGTIAGAAPRHLERALELLHGASHFFQTKLLPHLDEEEHGMFLLFRDRMPRGSTLIYELEGEHEQMRKLCERLREELSWVRHAKHRKPPVLADLQRLCAQITRLLSQHADREDRLLKQYSKSRRGESTGEPSNRPTHQLLIHRCRSMQCSRPSSRRRASEKALAISPNLSTASRTRVNTGM